MSILPFRHHRQPQQPPRHQRRHRQRGQALVEFGLVSLVFFLVVFGILDMARLFESWVTVQHAAREAARYAITGQTTCTGYTTRDDCIVEKAKAATTGLNGGGPTGSDIHVTYDAWDYSAYTAETDNSSGKQCDQIEVTVTYTHHFITPLLTAIAPGGITIDGRQRMTNEPFGQCNPGDGTG